MRAYLPNIQSVLTFFVLNVLFIRKINANQPLSTQHRKTSTNETDSELDRSSQYVGVVECPCGIHGGVDTPLFGYVFWSDIVYDINHAVMQNGDPLSIIMCPANYHDALHLPNMTIQQSNVLIQCGAMGEPENCIVDGAAITVGDNLKNVTIQGVEFVSQRHEFRIGKGSQTSLIRCRFSDTIFPDSETTRSAVVSHGDLTVVNSYFSGNYGGSAVHVVQHEASFTKVQFIENTASQHRSSASAIQVGDSVNGKVANVSIIDSCFENNIGTNIVFVQEGSLVLRSRENAYLSTAHEKPQCGGITIHLGNGTTCKTFRLSNVSCSDAFDRCGPLIVDTITPVATPVPSFNTSNISAEIISSPVQSAPSDAPAVAIKNENATEGTITSPVSTPKTILTLQPTVSDTIPDGDNPTTLLDLTTNDDIVPLDITSDITFESSGGDRLRGDMWILAIITPLITFVNW